MQFTYGTANKHFLWHNLGITLSKDSYTKYSLFKDQENFEYLNPIKGTIFSLQTYIWSGTLFISFNFLISVLWMEIVL